MTRTPRVLALLFVGGAVALGAVPAIASPAASGQPAPVSAVVQESLATAPAPGGADLTLTLVPRDRAALQALAARRGGTRAERRARVAALAPRAADRDAVVRAMRAAGLIAIAADPWTVRVSGDEATAERVFGVRVMPAGRYHRPDHEPTLPAALRGRVSAVLGFDSRPLVARRAVAYRPNDFRTAYNVPATSGGAGQTVASVQFGPWNDSDFQTFAAENGIPFTGQLTQIRVSGPPVSPVGNDTSGTHTEVALDLETILGGAPQAKQRAYFGTNDGNGIISTYNALAGEVASQGITTASTSYGLCERNAETSQSFVTAMVDVANRIVAAGATLFAASGDSGAFDCTGTVTDPTPSVDFPAVIPSVIGVGGTTLPAAVNPPMETGWNGSGGGMSDFFARPGYQSGVGIPGTNRLVPDVSSDANPNTGALIYDSAVRNSDILLGGTSLAAPMMASHLASALTSIGCTTGLGDVHTQMYASRTYHDVTAGMNNGPLPAGGFSAGPGFDEVTGLGTPNWTALIQDLRVGTPCAVPNAGPGPTPVVPEVPAAALLPLAGLAALGAYALRRRLGR